MEWNIVCADILEWAAAYDGPKFHSALMDCPYEYGFMGKSWDDTGISFQPETWAAIAEHLYPGAFGMTYGGARTFHRIAVAIEDAGLIIHPAIFGWTYGDKIPKSTRIDTQIDEAAGKTAERKKVKKTRSTYGYQRSGERWDKDHYVTEPATELAKIWVGHRYSLQVLNPALEPIIMWQKPYAGKPVNSITETGAGSIWIEGSRIGTRVIRTHGKRKEGGGSVFPWGETPDEWEGEEHVGGWPKNFIVVHHPECGPDGCHEDCVSPSLGPKAEYFQHVDWSYEIAESVYSSLPIFYSPKASRREREEGLDHMPLKIGGGMIGTANQSLRTGSGNIRDNKRRNPHPTVKPIAMNRYLATLLLPPEAYSPRRILIPFAGVMSEGIGALFAGWDYVEGVEIDGYYCELGEARTSWWVNAANEIDAFDPAAILKWAYKQRKVKQMSLV